MSTLNALKETLNRTRSEKNPVSPEVIELQDDEVFVPNPSNIPMLFELLLKRPRTLDRSIRDESRQAALIPKLLLIAMGGFVMYGVMMGLTIGVSGWTPRLTRLASVLESGNALIEFRPSGSPLDAWRDGTAFRLILAYAVGLVAATGICLPSLYFYGLLSGIRLSMRDVVVHALKSKATAAIALIGILPIYFVLCLTAMVFRLAPEVIEIVQWLGFAFPFLGGVWGTRSLYSGFLGLADTLPERLEEKGRIQRSIFLGRLVVAWSVCYSVIAPIMVFTIWERLQSR